MHSSVPTTREEISSFVGRRREQRRLIETLDRGVALVTITGLSGIGKTRLAHSAGFYFDDKGERVYTCDLADLETAADIEGAVAGVLGLTAWPPGRLEIAIAQLPKTLLILDSGERVASVLGRLLEVWLERCNNLQVILTSIVPLEIEGEARFELGPLLPEDAVTLYVQRAAEAGREIPQGELPVVQDLVGRLGWMPLAIELAAARARLLSPRDLVAGMGQRLGLVRSGSTGGKHGSVDEALALTWEQLSPGERRILARTSIFAGGFTLEAALEVLDENEDISEVLDLLDSLRGKTLLEIHEGESSRFSILESIRAFAWRELEEEGGLARISLRHGSYFVEQGEAALAQLDGDRHLEAWRSLQAERVNLESALSRLASQEPALAFRAGRVLARMAAEEEFPEATHPALETMVAAARNLGDERLCVQAAATLAIARSRVGDHDEGLESLEDALHDCERVGAPVAEASVHMALAAIQDRIGEGAQAVAAWQRARALSGQAADPGGEVRALLGEALSHLESGALDDAEACFEQANASLRRKAQAGLDGIAASVHGRIKLERGRFREARRALQDALDHSMALGIPSREGSDRLHLARLELEAARLNEVELHLSAALANAESCGDLRLEGGARFVLGCLQLQRGNWVEAEASLVQALRLLESAGSRLDLARALPFLATLEARAGRFSEAAQNLEDARAYFGPRSLSHELRVIEILEGCIDFARARSLAESDPSEAHACANRARAKLDEAQSASPPFLSAYALLRADAEAWEEWEASGHVPPQPVADSLRLGPDAEWFEAPRGERVDLRRRAAIRRMLDFLAIKRLETPGVSIDPRELFAAGWPGVKVRPETELKRVYIGIWTLRGLGLADLLLTRDEGYLLDPAVPLLRVAD